MSALRQPGRDGAAFWPVLGAVLLISVYPLVRYGGWWNVGNDTFVFTGAIRSVMDTGELVPAGYQVYPNGFGFQALSTFVINVGGMSLPAWQFYGAILLITWMVFPAWLLYREWVGSGRGAALATMLLFTQPELLFGIMRGTHEKFTRGLMLFCLFLLVYSLRSRYRPGRFAVAVLSLYLSLYALIAFNNVFATSFIVGTLLALGLVWLYAWSTRSFDLLSVAVKRLACILLVALVVAYIHIFYVYPPAKANLLLMQTMVDQIGALLLSVESTQSYTAYNPYSEPVFRAWTSPYIYFLLSLANWALLFGTGLIWMGQTIGWIRGRARPVKDVDLLPWAFFGAFAVLGVVAALADFSGVLTSNLQHRMFPTIGLVGVPIIAKWLLSVLRSRRLSVRQAVRLGMAAGIGALSVLAIVKATNEPVVSNQWQTYLPAEIEAVEWADDTLAGRAIWTGFDRRVVEVSGGESGSSSHRVILDRVDVAQETDNFLVSDLTRLQARRLRLRIPVAFDDFVTYDSGEAQIYHRRPRSPYQR